MKPRRRFHPTFIIAFGFLVSNRRTGQERWRKLATEQVPHGGKHQTPHLRGWFTHNDGQRLYACFGSQGLYCLTLDGVNRLAEDLGDMTTPQRWGEAITPVLCGDLLIVKLGSRARLVHHCLKQADR